MKMKGFRKDFVLTNAKRNKKNGASPYALHCYLTRKGFGRAAAWREVEKL